MVEQISNWLLGIWLTTIVSCAICLQRYFHHHCSQSCLTKKGAEEPADTDYILHNAQLTKFRWADWAQYISLGIIHDGVWKLMSLLKVARSFRSGIWSELQIVWGGMTHFWLYCKEPERGVYHACYNWNNEKVMQHLLFNAKQSNRIYSLHLYCTPVSHCILKTNLLLACEDTCASDWNALFSVNCFSFRLK